MFVGIICDELSYVMQTTNWEIRAFKTWLTKTIAIQENFEIRNRKALLSSSLS